MMTRVAEHPALAAGIVIGIVVGAVELLTGTAPGEAAISLAIIVGYAVLITAAGRRSETASALAGRPVDERWEHINLEACALALGLSAIVVMIAFLVANATGGDWKPYAFMGAAMAVSYFGSLVVLRVRH
jgi:hypothetical protein